MTQPEAKWIGIAGFSEAARRTLSDPTWRHVVTGLPPATRELLEAPPSPITWVSAHHALALYDGILQQVTNRRSEVLREIGCAQVTADLRGIYRLFVRLASAEFIAHRAASLYGSYWRNFGVVRAERAGPRSYDVVYEQLPWVRMPFVNVMLGGIEGAMAASGLAGLRVSVVQTSESHFRARASWT